MTQANHYARTQGLILLERIIASVGPIFTIAQARREAAEMGLDDARLRSILSRLTRSGWLARIKRGVYVMQSSLFHTTLHPYAIAAALCTPMAISHWSALAHHSLTTQIPPMVQVSTPRAMVTPEMRTGQTHRPRGRAVWKVMEIEFEFIQVKEAHFFGFQQVWVSQWHRVAITDPERTVLDMVAHPRIFGSLEIAIETLEAHRQQLNFETLSRYALRYNVGAIIKRLGWILESLGVPDSLLEPLRNYPVSSYHLLDPTKPSGGPPVAHWKVRNNLGYKGRNDDH